jgi:hypothetical protein
MGFEPTALTIRPSRFKDMNLITKIFKKTLAKKIGNSDSKYNYLSKNNPEENRQLFLPVV